MATTDEHGSKLPQPRQNKRVVSANFRRIAKTRPTGRACIGCGYRRQSARHNNGTHHKAWWGTLSAADKGLAPDLAPTS